MAESQQDLSAKFDPPPAPYVPARVYLAQIYWKRPEIVVLRALQSVFSLIAFSVMAAVLGDLSGNVKPFSYTLAIGVLAFVYALAQLAFSLWCILRGATSSSAVTPVYQYATFVLDTIITYFLISSGSSTATVIDITALCGAASRSNFCSRLSGSATFMFLAFLSFGPSSAFTGYYLVKCILKV